MSSTEVTAILVAIVGITPGILAYRNSRSTRKSVELAGSEVTVANWNRLIKNLYGEIERLTTLNDQERERAKKREHELTYVNEQLRLEVHEMQKKADQDRKRWAIEKQELIARIDSMSAELGKLKAQVKATLPDVADMEVSTKKIKRKLS